MTVIFQLETVPLRDTLLKFFNPRIPEFNYLPAIAAHNMIMVRFLLR